MMRHFIWLSLLVSFMAAAVPTARADEVALIGVIGGKAAVLALDGGEPKTVKLGQTWNGITVISVEKDRATVEIKGAKRVLQLGQHYHGAGTASGRGKAILAADPRGHFFAEGLVNGVPVRFVVDTGATMISLPRRDGDRLGLDYRSAKRMMTQTANGTATVFVVKLDTVKIGGIELHNVDALVHEGAGLNQALLGMSFLNRVEMQRESATMTLIQRF